MFSSLVPKGEEENVQSEYLGLLALGLGGVEVDQLNTTRPA